MEEERSGDKGPGKKGAVLMNDIFFFDSYAIVEIIKGNPDYVPFIKTSIITAKLNIFEVYYGLIRDVGDKEAEEFITNYYQFIVDFDESIIREAARFKLKNKKGNLSMTDCIGYMIANRMGIRFLTGDKEFRDLENVEFVK